jgi:hypothetical protein
MDGDTDKFQVFYSCGDVPERVARSFVKNMTGRETA